MTIFEIIPFILFLVVIGTAIAERINVPYPIILVIAGLIVSFTPGIPNWHPPSHIVLVLFLPPILFAAARLIALQDIQSYKSEIISLSVILVIITTILLALFLHAFMPEIPLSTALVLSAIVSPTDAVASTSILTRMNIKRSVIRGLEIESLFNDATSIMLYKVSILFVFLGSINIPHALTNVFIIGSGGIIVGLIFSYFTSLIIKEFLTESENELPIIMSVILAYVSYLFADRLGVSGVLAVVTAGLFHKRTEKSIKARTRLSEKSVWDTLIFFLNGLIFIVIGLQVNTYLKKVLYWPISQLMWMSLLTIAGLIIIRFLWISAHTYGVSLIHRFKKEQANQNRFPWKNILISSWSGMRGLISLALALAIPESLPNMSLFPYRNLIIFLTIVTILFTLLVQGLTLPLLVKCLQLQVTDKLLLKEVTKIYRQLTKKAIRHINELTADEHICSVNAKKLVDNYYKNRLLRFKVVYETSCNTHEVANEADQLLGKILDYERKQLDRMQRKRQISEEVYILIRTKIDRDEVGFASYK